jgi:phosphoribosylformylglycinamidine synthase subunit PurQ / glutaminase
MNKPRVLVIRAPGTNCDAETAFAFEVAGGDSDLIHISRLAEGQPRLERYQVFAIPGGFSYGDDLGAGKVQANELELRLCDQLVPFIERGGLVLGICNGFQVLVRAGLLPVPFGGQRVSLLPNTSGKYECRWVHLRSAPGSPCVFTRGVEGIDLAVGHGEGRLFVPPEAVDDIVPALHYCGADGQPAEYPFNPNGSFRDIAGLTDASGRVLGLMPHPDRFIRASQHPNWTGRGGQDADGDGMIIFRNAVQYAKNIA